MTTDVVRFSCPGCGSELETPEGTISSRCRYCDKVSLLGRPGRIVKRYYQPRVDAREARCIADRHLKQAGRALLTGVHATHLYYVPFYRFRGLSLACVSSSRPALEGTASTVPLKTRVYELRARNLDVTIAGSSAHPFGMTSLGVRPQARPTYAYRDDELPAEAIVIAADLLPDDSQARAFRMDSANLALAHGTKTLEFSEMVGERQDLIYFPIYAVTGQTGGVTRTLAVDALARRVMHETDEAWSAPPPGSCPLQVTDLRPEPHHCPNCGADFEPSEKSLAYACLNCDRLYLLESGGYRHMTRPLIGDGEGSLYPFWRFPMSFASPRQLATVSDFRRILTAEIPLLDKRKTGLPFFAYVPAFAGADSEWHLQTAVRLTRTQPWVEPTESRAVQAPEVALTEPEAREFASFGWNWLRTGYLNLRHEQFAWSRAQTGAAELVWLPLTDVRLKRSAVRAAGRTVRADML